MQVQVIILSEVTVTHKWKPNTVCSHIYVGVKLWVYKCIHTGIMNFEGSEGGGWNGGEE